MADNSELRERLIEKAKSGIKEAYSNEEYALMQAVNAWLELGKSRNLASERLAEWFGIYAPESVKAGEADLAKRVMELAEKGGEGGSSMGRRMNGDEASALKSFAEYGVKADAALESLEAYLKVAANRLMPNATYLTDEKIASELLSRAGSLERLATMPASTVQLLGAEKALFKHIKYGSKPPKYGVLFKLADVTSAPKDQKGRIARVYATKLSIALKADYFSKRFIADQLKKDLQESLKRIAEAPPRQRPQQRQERQGRFQPRKRFGRPDGRQRGQRRN